MSENYHQLQMISFVAIVRVQKASVPAQTAAKHLVFVRSQVIHTNKHDDNGTDLDTGCEVMAHCHTATTVDTASP